MAREYRVSKIKKDEENHFHSFFFEYFNPVYGWREVQNINTKIKLKEIFACLKKGKTKKIKLEVAQ